MNVNLGDGAVIIGGILLLFLVVIGVAKVFDALMPKEARYPDADDDDSDDDEYDGGKEGW